MDDVRLYARNKNQLDSLTQTMTIISKNIGMKFWHRKMRCPDTCHDHLGSVTCQILYAGGIIDWKK